MALHDDLLALAVRLVAPVPAFPARSASVAPVLSVAGPVAAAAPPIPEAELRRAISTAYYALFHLLINASTTRGVATVDLRPHVARNFEHRHMLSVCKKYTARHKADYNVKDVVTPVEAQTFVQMARDAFTDWAAVAANLAADTFLTELLVGGIKER